MVDGLLHLSIATANTLASLFTLLTVSSGYSNWLQASVEANRYQPPTALQLIGIHWTTYTSLCSFAVLSFKQTITTTSLRKVKAYKTLLPHGIIINYIRAFEGSNKQLVLRLFCFDHLRVIQLFAIEYIQLYREKNTKWVLSWISTLCLV